MSEYRVYLIGSDGHFTGVKELDCEDDDAAIKEAWQYVDGCDVELWNKGRFIARLTGPKG